MEKVRKGFLSLSFFHFNLISAKIRILTFNMILFFVLCFVFVFFPWFCSVCLVLKQQQREDKVRQLGQPLLLPVGHSGEL